jgi:hypothetical protein
MRIQFNNIKIFFAIFSIILLIGIFYWTDYLVNNGYIVSQIKEGFDNIIGESSDTSHTVSMPINTSSSCQNFCGPTSRCSVTGQQCFADIDCPGCQPISNIKNDTTKNVPGDNDAGKLTTGVTPTYSPLTSTYQTFLRVNTGKNTDKPAKANFGKNTWSSGFNTGWDLFKQEYGVTGLQFEPTYPETYTTTGQFKTDGPLPSNY